MPLVARASTTVRNKNLLIVVLCAAFCGWFAYDGLIGWPAGNDRAVASMRDTMIPEKLIPLDFKPDLDHWKGWNQEDAVNRERMSIIAKSASKVGKIEGWKDPLDISIQRWIILGLAGATLAAIYWFVHCQRRRVVADDSTVSPSPGVVIPWSKITKVDNTRWNKVGIVEITYTDDQGRSKKAKFDDYETQRDPLLSILDQLAEKAINAEFIPKEEPAGTAPPAESPAEPPAEPPADA